MCLHPCALPYCTFSRELCLRGERRLEKKEINGLFDDTFFALEAESRPSKRSHKTKPGQIRLFKYFTDGGFRQCLAKLLMPFWKCPSSIRIFDEKNFDLITAFAINNATSTDFVMAWPSQVPASARPVATPPALAGSSL